MTLREQNKMIDVANRHFYGVKPTDAEWNSFIAGYTQALSLIANPDDEMVERCAEGLRQYRLLDRFKPETRRLFARACLQAAAGGDV